MAGTELNKPIVIFTSFWDANYLLSKEFFVSEINDNPIIVWLKNKDGKPHNYSVSSVALRAPSLDKLPIIKEKHGEMSRLDFFCPTYKILTDYKSDPIMKFNWELYKSRFKPLLQSRKSDILDWVDSLESNKIYFLCCWESTSEKVHCHRQIIYNAFKASKKISDKVISIYRHGNKQLDTHDDLNDKLDDNFINTYIVGPDSFKYIESVATLGIKDNSAESPHIQLQSQEGFQIEWGVDMALVFQNSDIPSTDIPSITCAEAGTMLDPSILDSNLDPINPIFFDDNDSAGPQTNE